MPHNLLKPQNSSAVEFLAQLLQKPNPVSSEAHTPEWKAYIVANSRDFRLAAIEWGRDKGLRDFAEHAILCMHLYFLGASAQKPSIEKFQMDFVATVESSDEGIPLSRAGVRNALDKIGMRFGPQHPSSQAATELIQRLGL